jgi:hypothetical protein
MNPLEILQEFLDNGSASHNATQNKKADHISMSRAAFEPATPVYERLKRYSATRPVTVLI